MPFHNEHACRLVPPEKFDEEAFDFEGKKVKFLSKEQASGMRVIFGKIEGKTTAQTLRFPVDKFTPAEARKKCTDAGGTFEPAKPEGDE